MARKRRSGGLGMVAEAVNQRSGPEWLRLEDGDVEIVRVLQDTWKDGWTHRTPITRSGGDEMHVDRMCLDQKNEGVPCPGCNEDIRRTYKFWVKAIVRGDEESDDETKSKDRLVLFSGGKMIGKQLDKMAAKSRLDERDIEIEREGKGKNDTNYEVDWADDEENDLTEADLKLAEKPLDISRYTKIVEYDQFFESDIKDDDDEKPGEKSMRRGSAFGKRRKAAEDDDEEESGGRKVASRRRTSSSSSKSSGRTIKRSTSKTSGSSEKKPPIKKFGGSKKSSTSSTTKTTVRRRPR